MVQIFPWLSHFGLVLRTSLASHEAEGEEEHAEIHEASSALLESASTTRRTNRQAAGPCLAPLERKAGMLGYVVDYSSPSATKTIFDPPPECNTRHTPRYWFGQPSCLTAYRTLAKRLDADVTNRRSKPMLSGQAPFMTALIFTFADIKCGSGTWNSSSSFHGYATATSEYGTGTR